MTAKAAPSNPYIRIKGYITTSIDKIKTEVIMSSYLGIPRPLNSGKLCEFMIWKRLAIIRIFIGEMISTQSLPRNKITK